MLSFEDKTKLFRCKIVIFAWNYLKISDFFSKIIWKVTGYYGILDGLKCLHFFKKLANTPFL